MLWLVGVLSIVALSVLVAWVVQAPAQSNIYSPSEAEIPVDGCVQRANAGFLAPGQTKLSVCVDNVSTGTAATYYVPLPIPQAGKVWVITDWAMSHTATTGQRFAIAVGGVTIASLPAHGTAAPDILCAIETQPDCPGGLQPVLQITGASSMAAFANMFGFMQNAGAG